LGILRIARPILVAFLCSPTFSQTYYPLATNNRWDYITQYSDFFGSSVDTFTVRVAGLQTLPNGKEYYELQPGDIAWGRYVRVDSVGIYYFRESDSSDVLMYKLNAAIYETWEAHFIGIHYVELESIDTLVIFGMQTRVLNFRRDGLMLSDVSFSDIFGPIRYSSPGEPPGTSSTTTDASGCVINSTTYGQLLVSVSSTHELPDRFTLFQNNPNPFNSTTHISFDTPIEGTVHIRIFNPLGQEVGLIDHHARPGRNHVSWNASQLPSGIYFYRLESGSFSQVRKMLLVK